MSKLNNISYQNGYVVKKIRESFDLGSPTGPEEFCQNHPEF